MAKRITQPKDEEIARRAMDLARQVTNRVFISRSGIYLVSGSPDFQKLRSYLADLTEPPQDSAVPTPLDLGFHPSGIIPMNNENLSAWGRGLQKWRKIIDDYEKPKAKTSERRQKFQQWKDEVERISHNLERLWDIYRKYEAGIPIDGAPYVRVNVTESGNGISVPFVESLWNWLEKLVAWIAGEKAGIRFHHSLLPFTESQSQYEKREHFARVLPRLKSLQKRADSLSAKAIANAVRKIVNSIPMDIRVEFDFSLPSRARDFHIESIIDNCIKAANNHLLLPPQLVVATAILCATDGATAPLPEWLFHSNGESGIGDIRIDAIWELYDQHLKTGYEKLLCALQDMPSIHYDYFRIIRKFLVNGEDVNSILWTFQNLRHHLADMIAEAGLSPQPFRSLISALGKAGLTIDSLKDGDNNLYNLVELVCKKKSMDIIKTFAMWLQSLESGTLNLNLARWAWNSLFHLLILANASPSFRAKVKLWAKPPKTDVLNTLVDDAPPEVYPWLSQLSYYQELCGKEPTLPKTVSKMLNQADRQRQQIEYLRKMRDAGQLNKQATAKLELFETRDCVSHKPAMGRLLKHLREVCAHTALEAVSHLTWRESQRIWARQFGRTPPPTFLTKDEVTAIVVWSRGLEEKPRGSFYELVDGWKQHGADYRQHLSRNNGWVKEASDRINIKAWFCPETCEVDIDGLPIKICVSSDPFRIFLMGSYFGTCLSLDKFNCDSVLANAYDANKAVVFAMDANGQVLVRKLVCVNSDYKLIGYRVYISDNTDITSSRRKGIAQAINAFVIDLAEQTGMQPGDDGVPEELSGLFWYDDGVQKLKPGGRILHPVLQEVIQGRQQQCVNLLTELGIWPPIDSTGKSSCLESMPELAEECLAVLARTVEDRQLAHLVFQNAMTKGGKIEAITSLGLLVKSDEMAEYVYSFSKKQYDLENYELYDRGMEVLCQMGTSKAWHLFMEMEVCLNVNEWKHSFWLILAAADSQERANALFQILLSSNKLDMSVKLESLLLMGELLAHRGCPLPQAVLTRVLTTHLDYSEARFEYVQWCPPCPDVMKRQNIQKIIEKVDGYPGSYSSLSILAAVILSMKNQGARDMTFLKETASHDLSALLALALQRESKHQAFIRKTALAFPSESAALLALIESEGMEKAEELLASTIKDTPGIAEKWQKTVALHNAFLQLDQGHPVSYLPVKEQLVDALPLLPHILFWLWKWTDYERPNVPALAALTASDNFAILLHNAKVNKLGLVARMAILLRFVDDKSAALLRNALYAIVNIHEYQGLGDEHVLFLGKLSGHKLWIEAPTKEDQKLSTGNVINCSGGWELLIDSEGNFRPVVKWINRICPWSDPRLPLDIHFAVRVMNLMCSVDNVNYDSWQFYPITEIQRQLHYIAKARSSVSLAKED